MNRALRAAAIGALLLTPVTVSACSAGQLNQTSAQQRDKTGPMASVGALSLREVELAYPSSGSYASGDDAELTMTIANGGNDADQLTSVSGDDFTGFRISGTGSGVATGSASGSASGSAAASTTGAAAATTTGSSATTTSGPGTGTSTPSPSAGTSGSSTAGSTATGSGIAGATGSPSSGAATSAAGGAQSIAIPAQSIVQLGQNPTPHLFLEGLSKTLTPGQRVTVTFTFAKAGTVTVQVVVAAPSEYQAPTSSFDFNPAHDPATTSSAGQG